MKQATFNIKMRTGESRQVTGYIVNDIYGIDKRITQKTTYNEQGEEKVSQSSDFFLTHIPTGVLITNARTRKALMELVNRPDMVDQNDMHQMALAVAGYWNQREWKD